MDRETVENALDLLRANYIFPDRAEQAATAIGARLDAGEYSGMDEAELAERLTTQLFEVCSDKHLRVRYRAADENELAENVKESVDAWRADSQARNHGISRVERFAGNIGYLDLRSVEDPQWAGPAMAAAMELVAHTRALIIDLRQNGGGWPQGVIFWNSYLFPDGDTHLNSTEDRSSGTTRQYWSLSYVPGQRYIDRPVYLLIGKDTYSAGEEICYNLKAQGRATLVGAATRGGAHPSRAFPVTQSLEIRVPIARAVNPVTGTNWEGIGVEPDVVTDENCALNTAYRMALEHVVADTASMADLSPAARTAADVILKEAKAALAQL